MHGSLDGIGLLVGQVLVLEYCGSVSQSVFSSESSRHRGEAVRKANSSRVRPDVSGHSQKISDASKAIQQQ